MAFQWPLDDLTVSDRDKENPMRKDIPSEIRPVVNSLYDVVPK